MRALPWRNWCVTGKMVSGTIPDASPMKRGPGGGKAEPTHAPSRHESVAALLLDAGIQHALELVAGAADRILHVVVVVAGGNGVVVLQPCLQRAALVIRAALDRVQVGEEHLDPAQAREIVAELLLQ